MERPRLNLLQENLFEQHPENARFYDYLKEVYDRRFYHYGEHFRFHYEKLYPLRQRVKQEFYKKAIDYIVSFKEKKTKNTKPTILSTAYFDPKIFQDKYTEVNISRPPWAFNSHSSNVFSKSLHQKSSALRNDFENANLFTITTDAFFKQIEEYEELLKQYILDNNIISIFLAHDVGFFEKLAIKVFRDLGLPTFVFVHGLQFWLNKHDFNRGDFLVVWGEASKADFVKNGFDEHKIIVSGHPTYRKSEGKSLKFGLDNILVLGNALNGVPLSDDYYLSDRSNCIYYLNLIRDTLMAAGVRSVRLRPHPCEDPGWYLKNTDNSFFRIDTEPISASLAQSSLVIGPTSTVLLDAIRAGVNYTVFNPVDQSGNGLTGTPVPSFYNGGSQKVPVAKNTNELFRILTEQKLIDRSVLSELVEDEFSLAEVMNRINTFRGSQNKEGR